MNPLRTSEVPSSRLQLLLCTAIAASSPGTILATDGYFSDGYGIKSKGRAGVAIAETDNAFAGANNPATLSWTANRLDVGVDWFRPNRDAARTGPAVPLNGTVKSDRDDFFIPEFGYARALNQSFSLGLTLYGNGGMNTDYPAGQLNLGPGASGRNLLAGPGHLGVNLSQVLLAPSISWKFHESQSIALAPIVGYQRFKAYGLAAFSPLSQDPTALTDVGLDESWGGGVRVGYLWNIRPEVALGATYASPVFNQGFSRYRGLFAGDGSFDIPQNLGLGIAWQVSPEVRLAADYKWIDYAGVDAVGNSSSNPGRLGQSGGPGFGWRSISVFKVGADWKVAEHWTLRGGYSFNENPVRSEDVTFNILAPAVIQHHVAAGLTFEFGRHELTLAYVHAFENTVTGESKFVALGQAPAGTQERIRMSQDSLGLAYGFKF